MTVPLAKGAVRLLASKLNTTHKTSMVLTELSPFIMAKHFGVSLQQAQRVQALLRLGVTEEDVSIAERLMRSRSDGPDQSPKIEWLLGCSVEDMSRLKALEVLGITSAMLEEERARILGSLGVKCWGNPGTSSLVTENSRDNADPCVFRKRRCTESEAPRVTELEDECLSQHLRIQQLELQVAALVRTTESRADKINNCQG